MWDPGAGGHLSSLFLPPFRSSSWDHLLRGSLNVQPKVFLRCSAGSFQSLMCQLLPWEKAVFVAPDHWSVLRMKWRKWSGEGLSGAFIFSGVSPHRHSQSQRFVCPPPVRGLSPFHECGNHFVSSPGRWPSLWEEKGRAGRRRVQGQGQMIV